ncbi:MAG: hypothetical protein FWE67_03520 [Planctomycetaceae bacterium]|nr:hypothetical protein [Planctomycetaceae bacterium]
MPQYLALDWDEYQCRYVLASVGRNTVSIRKAGIINWTASPQTEDVQTDEEEKTKETPADDSTSLKTALQTLCGKIKDLKFEPCRSLLSLNRSKTEILYQKLPPCKEAELPVLLKNQVLRELPTCTDFDPLDYLPLNNKNAAVPGWNLLALTIPLSYRQLLTRSFRSIHFPPQQIGFRAAAAASLFLALQNADNPILLVNNTGLDTDLILIDGKQIDSIRSFRLPPEIKTEEAAQRIADEVRRTVLAGLDSETSVQKIVIFGTETEHTELQQQLTDSELETEIINPFALPWIDMPRFSAGSSTEEADVGFLPAGQFAPLIGLLSEHLSERKERLKFCSVDFLRPREAPKPVNLIRTLLLAVVLLIIVGTGLFFWNRGVIQGMEKELADLQKEYKKTVEQYRQIQPIYNVLRQTQNWDSQNVVWLNELWALSASLPGEQDLMISQMTFTAGSSNPRIQLNGMVRDPSVLRTFQTGLNASGHYQMRNPQITRNPAGGGYPFLFQTTIMKVKR